MPARPSWPSQIDAIMKTRPATTPMSVAISKTNYPFYIYIKTLCTILLKNVAFVQCFIGTKYRNSIKNHGGSKIFRERKENTRNLKQITGVHNVEMIILLSLKVCQFFKHRVGNCNNTAVCLESSLSCDHICKLCRKVNVTHFENA